MLHSSGVCVQPILILTGYRMPDMNKMMITSGKIIITNIFQTTLYILRMNMMPYVIFTIVPTEISAHIMSIRK